MSYTNRYRAHGMSRPVDPGIDVSHYGAPYQGMLGLGNEQWSPSAGQSPADDPRVLKRYSKVVLSYAVRGVPPGSAGPDALRAKVAGAFPGQTVRTAWGNGWGSGANSGRIGAEVTLATPTQLGLVKRTSKGLEGPLTGAGLSNAVLTGAQTHYRAEDLMTATERAAHAGGQVTPPSTGLPPSLLTSGDPAGGNVWTRPVAGLPVWGWGLLGLGTVGALVAVMSLSGSDRAAATAAPTAPVKRNRSSRLRKRRGVKANAGRYIYWGQRRYPVKGRRWYVQALSGSVRFYDKTEAKRVAQSLAKRDGRRTRRVDRKH